MKNKILAPDLERAGSIFGDFQFEDARIRVTLDSIRHVATDAVRINFDVSTTITDGLNPRGEFTQDNIIIIPNHTSSIDKTIFTGYYENKCKSSDPIDLNFIFLASNDVVANVFSRTEQVHLNENGLHKFQISISLTDGIGRRSTLEFKGIVEIGCT